MNSQELASKYIKLARENVNLKKVFPPNKYTFTVKYFRQIEGWDKEWYDMMYNWESILTTQGWKSNYYDKNAGESSILNFQYLYDSELPSGDLSKLSINDINKIMNFSHLKGEKCSQLCLNEERLFSILI